MQPNSEPSQTDVSAVAQAMGIPDTVQQTPAPQPQAQPQAQPQQPTEPVAQPVAQPQAQPAQQQPQAPTPQPAPSQQQGDPFTQLFPDVPTEPTAQQQPQPTQQPSEPTAQPQQPVQPQPQAQPQPGQVVQPQAQPQTIPGQSAPGTPQTNQPAPVQSFDDYMNSILGDLPEAPAMPDPSKVNPEDEASIGQFFTDLMTTAEKRMEANFTRKQAIQNSERQLWDGAFEKYGSLRENKPLRDMVHAIRRADFDKGIATTPTQAADRLLDALKAQYNRGAADSQVITTIEQVQPQGGGGTEIPTTLNTTNVLESVQTGGEVALTDFLNKEIQAGRL